MSSSKEVIKQTSVPQRNDRLPFEQQVGQQTPILLQARFFGTLQIWRDGLVVTQFKTKTERALLVYLLLHAGRPLARRFVATMLWPESSESAALKNLRVVLTRLRKTLHEQKCPDTFIVADRTQMWFNTAVSYAFDVADFETAVAQIQALPTADQLTKPEAIAYTRQAVTLYEGELLSGFDSGSELFDDWLLTQRRELHRSAVWVGSLAVRQAERRGEYGVMERLASQLIVWEPWHEEAHQWLMHALQVQGQRQAALLHYEHLRERLDAELGVAPGRQLKAFHLWLSVGEMEADAVKLEHKTAAAIKGNLPAELTPYFGREKELTQLKQQLMGATHRLVTLTGSGGVGKTRMALATARHLASGFADGAWFVELADIQTDETNTVEINNTLARVIASALQLHIKPQQQIINQVIEWLHGRHCLLILDNIDDLLDGVSFVTALLRRAPKITIIATSREPLECYAESIFLLEGLAIPPQFTAADTWRQYAATQLFVDRARRMKPSFNVTIENWPLIVRLCREVAGTPLAIELAASALRTISLEELLAKLADSISVLATNRRDLPSRHRTMQAAIDASWRVLSADERHTLTHLSVFRHSFSSRSARLVSQATAVSLDALVTKSLLQRLPNGRLALHPLLRHYAAARLPASQAEIVSNQHAIHFLERLSLLQSDLFGKHPLEAARRMEPDIDNIQQAFRSAARQGYDGRLSHTLNGIVRLYKLLGLMESFDQLLEAVQKTLKEAPSTSINTQLQTRIWLEQARICEKRGDLPQAVRLVEAALKQLKGCPDDTNFARAYLVMGDIRQKDGFPLKARADFEMALEVAEQGDDVCLLVDCLSRLTYFMTRTSQYNERAVNLAREHGDRWLEARALQLLGISEANAGRYEGAYQCFAQLLLLNIWLSSEHFRKINIFSNLGRVMQLLGDYERALAQYERSHKLASMLQDESDLAYALLGISSASRSLGNFERALETAVTAQQLIINQGSQADKVFAYLAVGQVQLAVAEIDQAQNTFAIALESAEAIGLKMFSVLCRAGLIDVFLAKGETETAVVQAELIWHYLQTNSLNLTLDPFYIFWQTIRAFDAVADPRLDGLLQRAYDQLQKTAQQITDEHLHHLFLNRIDNNRELANLWAQRNKAQVKERISTHKRAISQQHLQTLAHFNETDHPQKLPQNIMSPQNGRTSTISNVKRAKFTHYFNLTDLAGNGLITKSDYLEAAKRVIDTLGLPPHASPAQQLQAAYVHYWETITTADRDGNGAISLDEWIDHFHKLGQDPARIETIVLARGKTIVKLFDTNRDNRVSRAEWGTFFKTVGYPTEEFEIAFNKLDQDADGYLSLDELNVAGTQFFSSDDVNAPGNWIYGDFTKYLET